MTASKTQGFYGKGAIHISDVEYEIENFGGTIVIHVVNEADQNCKDRICYGLFYQAPNGDIFDIFQSRAFKLKTFKGLDPMIKFLAFRRERQFQIPVLSEENVIQLGSLR